MGAHVPEDLDEEEGEDEEERRPGPVEAVVAPGDQGVQYFAKSPSPLLLFDLVLPSFL